MVAITVPEITQITRMKVDFLKNLTNVTTHMVLKKRSVMQRYFKFWITFHREQKKYKNSRFRSFVKIVLYFGGFIFGLLFTITLNFSLNRTCAIITCFWKNRSWILTLHKGKILKEIYLINTKTFKLLVEKLWSVFLYFSRLEQSTLTSPWQLLLI